ncbi:MAG: TonB-dependent receptor plug domain-containing protein [Deltaproteobacteria bacterium]|jgi:outer membrane receptor protein involved in Fe transport/opacity protein-like surface antigen|nr:TonB-dependent receptor plug domain-containing protein [Deltaproteobacteria bacterium]
MSIWLKKSPLFGVAAIWFLAASSQNPGIMWGQNQEADNPATLETVTVEGERPQWERVLSPGSMSIVITDQFKGEQKNLATLLENVPGLFVHRVTGNGQFTTVKVRGSTGAQVNVYVDGVLQNLGNDVAVDISLIPVSQVARVEVYRGYIPARFAGSPIGGVINVVTKKPEKLGADLSVGASSYNTQNYTVTASLPTIFDGALLIGAHRDKSDNDFRIRHAGTFRGFLNLAEDSWQKLAAYSNNDFLLKWQNERFSLKTGYKTTWRQLPNAFNRPLGGIGPYRTQNVNHKDLVLGYRDTWGNLDLGVQAHYLNQDKRHNSHDLPTPNSTFFPALPGMLYDYRETERFGGQIDLSYKLGESNLLEFHGDYSHEKTNVDANAWTAWDFNTGAYVPYPNYRLFPVYIEKRWHLQLQDTITMGAAKDLKLTLSYRLDGVKSQGNSRYDNLTLGSWGMALKKELTPNVTFRTTAGTFNRYPNFTERFGDGYYVLPAYYAANSRFYPNPTWERGEQWDIGVDTRGHLLGAALYSSASYFNRYTKNIITMYTNPDFAYYRNTGAGKVQGVEFEGGAYWKKFDLDASFTWQRGNINRHIAAWAFYTTEGFVDPIPNLPQIQYKIRGTYRPAGWLSLFAEYSYTDDLYNSMYASGTNEDWVMDTHLSVTNAGLRWNVYDNFTLTTGVNDILNNSIKQYQILKNRGTVFTSTVPYPQVGRVFFATLEYSFDNGSSTPTADHGSPFDTPEAAGDGAGGPFYLATKAIYSKVKTDLSGEMWRYGAGDTNGTYDPNQNYFCQGYDEPYNFDEWTFTQPCYIFPRGFNYDRPVPGGNGSHSTTNAALSFGVDFHKLNGFPIRLELEGTLHDRQNIDYNTNNDVRIDLDNTTWFLDQPAKVNIFEGKQNMSARTYNVFLNGFIDWRNKTRFTPYVGGGLGLTHFHVETKQDIAIEYDHTRTGFNSVWFNPSHTARIFRTRDRKWDFAWNFSVGCSYQVSDNAAIDISYRYVDLGAIKIRPSLTGAYRQGLSSTVPATIYYADNSGQTLKMSAHQAVLTLRFYL